MEPSSTIELNRDCPAVLIPQGTAVTLAAGTIVDITQSLGGNFTVRTPEGLFQIAGRDADALGQSVPTDDSQQTDSPQNAPADPISPNGDPELTEEKIWDVLKSCFDPEIPLNIVDLGLIYDLRMEPTSGGRMKVEVKMTLTAPGCGMGGVIAGDAQQKILMLEGVEEATVEVVWEPPWHQSMITPEGRRVLGIG